MNAKLTFERYELKYLLNPAQLRAVLHALEGPMHPDCYGEATIRNIYTLTTGGGRENGKTHADDAFPGGGRGGMIGPGGQPPEDFGGGQTPSQSEESAQTEEAAAEESVSTKGFKAGAASARNRPKRARRRKGAPLEAPPSAPKNPQPNGCGFLGERKEREKFGVWCCLRIYHTPEAVGSCERTEKSL